MDAYDCEHLESCRDHCYPSRDFIITLVGFIITLADLTTFQDKQQNHLLCHRNFLSNRVAITASVITIGYK